MGVHGIMFYDIPDKCSNCFSMSQYFTGKPTIKCVLCSFQVFYSNGAMYPPTIHES